MLRTVRSVLRWMLGVEALSFALAITTLPKVMSADPSAPPASHYGFIALLAVLALLFASAWWITRRPPARRAYAAALCCILNLANLLVFVHLIQPLTSVSLAVAGLLIALNVAGAFLFLQSAAPPIGRAPQPAYRTPRDCTSRATDLLFEALMIVAFWQSWRLWDRWAGPHRISPAPFIVGLLAFGLAVLVMATIHELGHALAGHAVGMKLLSFTVGPFSWSRVEGRIRFKLVVPVLGGSVQTLPLQVPTPRNEILVLLGGVLANLCSAPLFVWAALRVRTTGPEYVYEFLYTLVVLSTVGALANLFPFHITGDAYSDGARIFQVLTHSPAIDYRRTMQRLQSTAHTPLRLRDLDPTLFQQIAIERAGYLTGFHARICAATIFSDRGRADLESAELAEAEACYDNFAIDLPALLYTPFIRHYAIHHRDAAASRLWWNRMNQKKLDPAKVDTLLAAGSLAWIEGRAADAEAMWQQADAVARALPQFGVYETDRDDVAALRTLLDGPAQPLLVPETAAPEQVAAKPAPWPSRRQALLIASVSAALLAVAMVPSGYPQSFLWHAVHGNQAAVGKYKLTLPLNWHPATHNSPNIMSFTSTGNGARIWVYQSPPQDQTDDQRDQTGDQQTDPLPEQAATFNGDSNRPQVIQVTIKAKRFNLYCLKVVAEQGPYGNLNCRAATGPGIFIYEGPETVEPEAKSILATLQ